MQRACPVYYYKSPSPPRKKYVHINATNFLSKLYLESSVLFSMNTKITNVDRTCIYNQFLQLLQMCTMLNLKAPSAAVVYHVCSCHHPFPPVSCPTLLFSHPLETSTLVNCPLSILRFSHPIKSPR